VCISVGGWAYADSVLDFWLPQVVVALQEYPDAAR